MDTPLVPAHNIWFSTYPISRGRIMQKWMNPQEAARQAAAILALEGDEPDDYERRQRVRLERGEITGDEFLELMVKHVQGDPKPRRPKAA